MARIVVAVVAAVVTVAVTAALVYIGVPYPIAAMIGAAVGSLVAYGGNRIVDSMEKKKQCFYIFLLKLLVTSATNIAILAPR